MLRRSRPRDREILLADVDTMFVSVARLVWPEVAETELLIVGGQGPRGVVTSASYPCRAYGVRAGMPIRHALALCPNARVVDVPREAVREKSRAIREILSGYAVTLEPASVDEFYLDVTGVSKAMGLDLEGLARRIREHALKETRLSLSIGGGTNRLIAKMAANACKPAGVLVIAPGEEEAFLENFGLADIPGIGPRSAERYARYGLRSVRDARRFSREALVGWFGEKEGNRLWERIRGIDDTPVSPPGPAKSHSREETFPVDLYSDRDLETELLALAIRVSGDLRADGRLARTVTVRIRDRDFLTRQASRTLDRPIASERAVYTVALELMSRLRARRRTGVRLLGVALSGLVDPREVGKTSQLALFDDEPPVLDEEDRDRRISRAVDALRKRFGEDIVLPATLLRSPTGPKRSGKAE